MLPTRVRKVMLISTDGIELMTSLKVALGQTSDTSIFELGLRALAREKSKELARVKQAKRIPVGVKP
jgi:hypothetical protein